ncbi:MAG: hypothetical protein JOZ51_19220 [Chloroflexi bacterium]|nr:hypothetical protein [Chloroflexota bacterium]
MSEWLYRFRKFTGFTVREYVRSGRIVIEILAMLAALWLLFWPRSSRPISSEQFFGLGGLVFLGISAYTTLIVMRMGYRPQNYVVLFRSLGRAGYLAGLYTATVLLVGMIYLLLSVLVAILHSNSLPFSFGGWLLGSLPLLLNVMIVAAFMTLTAPLVVSGRLRLVLLALVLLALSQDRDVLGDVVGGALGPIQTILGLPLMPVLGGFNLAVQHSLSLAALGIMLAQVVLAGLLLAVALLAFERRELILQS